MSEKASLPEKNRGRNAEAPPTPGQVGETAQTAGHGPPSELSKYAALATELRDKVRHLVLLHELRDTLEAKADALKAEHGELEQKVLDGNHDAIAEIVQLGDAMALNDHKFSALRVRIDRAETELHSCLPAAGARFERLRGFLRTRALERATGRLAALLEPAWRGRPEVTALAEHELEYVQAASLTLPSTGGWATTRPLNDTPIPFGSLARAFSKEEIALARAQTVDAIKSTAAELVKNGRAIIKECEAFGPEGVPEFALPPEPRAEQISHPEWNESLNPSLLFNQPATVSVSEDPWCGPFDLEGVDVQAEVRKLMAADPTLTIVTATPLLREKFPQLFKRFSALQGPLLAPPPETTKVPEELLIGNTFNL